MTEYEIFSAYNTIPITKDDLIDTINEFEFLDYDKDDDRFTEFEASDIGGPWEYFGFIRKKPKYTHMLVSEQMGAMVKKRLGDHWNNVITDATLKADECYLFNPSAYAIGSPQTSAMPIYGYHSYPNAKADLESWMAAYKRKRRTRND